MLELNYTPRELRVPHVKSVQYDVHSALKAHVITICCLINVIIAEFL